MNLGTILVMIAACLWAIDALIRTPITQLLNPVSIVFWEHIFGIFILSPFILPTLKIVKKIPLRDWGWFTLLAGISSVGGTLLFTQALGVSFASGDFITPLLLQKLQPLIVISLSYLFLKEKIQEKFLFFALIAILGGYLMSFGIEVPSFSLFTKNIAVLYALGATTLWAVGTIISKTVLKYYAAKDATIIRFVLAIPIAFLLSFPLSQSISFSLDGGTILRFIAIALSTGAVALLIYYYGLKRTPAHLATIAELLFPFTSLLIGLTPLNPYGAAQQLTFVQGIGILLLLIGVYKATMSKEKLPTISGIVEKGNKEGRKLGFPTANITLTKQLTIPFGVYATTITLDGKRLNSVTHYGPRVIFNETKPLVEVHIFDFNKTIYDKKVTVEFKQFIRGTEQFASLEDLIRQMEKDKQRAKELLLN